MTFKKPYWNKFGGTGLTMLGMSMILLSHQNLTETSEAVLLTAGILLAIIDVSEIITASQASL